MIHVNSSGSAYEIGFQHGTACPEAIRLAYEACVNLEGIAESQINAGIRLAEARLQSSFPEILEEMQGIADGSGVSYREIVTLNCIDVVVGNALGAPSCSTIGFADSDFGVLLGKTADWSFAARDRTTLWQRLQPAPGEGHALVHYGMAGAVWTEGGLNDVGLGLVLNGLPGSGPAPGSIPWLPLPRAVLQYCATVEEALGFLDRHDVMYWGFSLILADAAGDLALIEVVPGAQARCRPADDHLIHANHCVRPETASREVDSAIGAAYQADVEEVRHNSEARYETLEHIVPSAPRTLRGMEGLLRHGNGPGSISQSGQAGMHTVYAMVVAPAQGKIWGAEGYPPDVPFVEYEI